MVIRVTNTDCPGGDKQLTIILKNAQEFQKLLMKKGYSFRSFAKLAGMSSAHISYIVNGKRNPNPATAKKIAEALEMDFDDIFFIENGN
jgi:transcriptional regulator with XRE-family HTH domain